MKKRMISWRVFDWAVFAVVSALILWVVFMSGSDPADFTINAASFIYATVFVPFFAQRLMRGSVGKKGTVTPDSLQDGAGSAPGVAKKRLTPALVCAWVAFALVSSLFMLLAFMTDADPSLESLMVLAYRVYVVVFLPCFIVYVRRVRARGKVVPNNA